MGKTKKINYSKFLTNFSYVPIALCTNAKYKTKQLIKYLNHYKNMSSILLTVTTDFG